MGGGGGEGVGGGVEDHTGKGEGWGPGGGWRPAVTERNVGEVVRQMGAVGCKMVGGGRRGRGRGERAENEGTIRRRSTAEDCPFHSEHSIPSLIQSQQD